MASKTRRRGASGSRDANVNSQILLVLNDGALTTKEIATELGLESRNVYSRCKRLEQKELLKSKLVVGRGPMYCVDEDKVVDRSQYEHCKGEGHEMRPIDKSERVWRLP